MTGPRALPIDTDGLWRVLLRLLAIPSPTGYTDQIVRTVVDILESMDVACELTRRGAIRATLPGIETAPKRAVVAHLDTTGAMVRGIKDDGRLRLAPVGTWSSRFAEGARVSIMTEDGVLRGTILPLLSSGHIHGDAVDRQETSWDAVEVRVDRRIADRRDAEAVGIRVGDFVACDPWPEIGREGFINARHLDDKAGVAALLMAIRSLRAAGVQPRLPSNILFTISEEVGSGASTVLHGDVAELVSIDNGTPGTGQSSTEFAVTVAAMDASGPFDYHLSRHLVRLCRDHGLEHGRDVFRNYRSDAASAVEAGNDLRAALVCFGVDSSHGHERTHLESLVNVASLIALYLQSPPAVRRDRKEMDGIEGFPEQLVEEPPAGPVVPEPLPETRRESPRQRKA